MAHVRHRTLSRARVLRRSLTEAETLLWWRLKQVRTLHFKKQHPVGPFIADFACASARLIVEIDGATHGTDAERSYDERREKWLTRHAWRVIRITNVDVFEDSERCAEMICAIAEERLRSRKR